MRFASALDIYPGLRNLRLRLRVFKPRRCLRPALRTLIFPDLVSLNRLAADLFVFNFGIFLSLPTSGVCFLLPANFFHGLTKKALIRTDAKTVQKPSHASVLDDENV